MPSTAAISAKSAIQIQIKAAEKFGSSGWMFWNPRNIYPKGGFTSSRGEDKDATPVAAPAATPGPKAPNSLSSRAKNWGRRGQALEKDLKGHGRPCPFFLRVTCLPGPLA